MKKGRKTYPAPHAEEFMAPFTFLSGFKTNFSHNLAKKGFTVSTHNPKLQKIYLKHESHTGDKSFDPQLVTNSEFVAHFEQVGFLQFAHKSC